MRYPNGLKLGTSWRPIGALEAPIDANRAGYLKAVWPDLGGGGVLAVWPAPRTPENAEIGYVAVTVAEMHPSWGCTQIIAAKTIRGLTTHILRVGLRG